MTCQNEIGRTSARGIIVRLSQRGSEVMLIPLWLSTIALQRLLESGQVAARQLEVAQLGQASSFKVACRCLPTQNPLMQQVILKIVLKREV